MTLAKEKSFFDRVYEVCRLIPVGRVSTYGAIAKYISLPKAARMVGWALNKCETAQEYVPAHRVVNRTGLLTGKQHFGGSNIMKELLQSEGIVIVDNQITNFDKVFWDPSKELQ